MVRKRSTIFDGNLVILVARAAHSQVQSLQCPQKKTQERPDECLTWLHVRHQATQAKVD